MWPCSMSDTAFPAPVAFRDGAAIRQAETVMAIGYPYGEHFASSATASVTSGTVSALAGMGNDDIRFMRFTAPGTTRQQRRPAARSEAAMSSAWSSAKQNLSPVRGDVPQNVNLAVKSGVVREFLDTNGVKYRSAPSTAELKPVDIAEQARQAAPSSMSNA